MGIAESVSLGIGSLATLVAKLIGASKEEEQQILADMRAEVAKMTSTLSEGGTMDQAIAASDKKLDAYLDKVEHDTNPAAKPTP